MGKLLADVCTSEACNKALHRWHFSSLCSRRNIGNKTLGKLEKDTFGVFSLLKSLVRNLVSAVSLFASPFVSSIIRVFSVGSTLQSSARQTLVMETYKLNLFMHIYDVHNEVVIPFIL